MKFKQPSLSAVMALCLMGAPCWGNESLADTLADNTTDAVASRVSAEEGAQGEQSESSASAYTAASMCGEYQSGESLNLEKVKVSRLDPVPLAYVGFNILEGPVWHNGALYYSNIGSRTDGQQVLTNQSTVWRWKPDTAPEVWLDDRSAGVNGMAVSGDGHLLAGRQLDGSIVKINPSNRDLDTLASVYEDKRFNSPNDLAVAADGTIYFTDPNWNTPSNVAPETVQGGGQVGRTTPGQRVYRVRDGVVTALSITEQVRALRDKPNGIALSLDDSKLFVGGAQGLWMFELRDGWPIKPKQVLASAVDGMGRDCAGNLYLTTSRKLLRRADAQIVLVLDKDLNEVGFIEVPAVQIVTNVAFGGVENKTLFITTLGTASTDEQPVFCGPDPCLPASIFTAELNVPGLPY